MSVIDQAAKRLEELRRAGVSDLDPSGSAGDSGAIPTPEAMVRALESRGEVGDVDAPTHAEAAPAAAKPHRAPTRPRARRSPAARTFPINLEHLKARGFVTPDAPTSQIADEFRVIKRPIIRNATGRGGAKLRNGNVVMVTSSLPAEGKTFTAFNLAMSVALEYDHTVLLVDGDLAHPSVPRLLGLPSSPGLLDLLTNPSLGINDAIIGTDVEGLSILPAGASQRRVTELVASEQMGRLVDALANEDRDRIVIFDSSPLLATTEARVLASHMGQIVMVVAAEATSQNTLNMALATIENCEVVLMMLNKASLTEVGTYGYYPGNDRG
jgi:exopolysaccharide/PEP-CTERM locus tyrosine autokinase